FSASPIPTTFSGDSFSLASAAARPLALLMPGGSTMTAPLLKTICSSSPEIAYRLEDNLLVGLPGRDDAGAYREGIDLATARLLGEKGGRPLPERDFLPCRRLDKHPTVLNNRKDKQLQLKKHPP